MCDGRVEIPDVGRKGRNGRGTDIYMLGDIPRYREKKKTAKGREGKREITISRATIAITPTICSSHTHKSRFLLASLLQITLDIYLGRDAFRLQPLPNPPPNIRLILLHGV